MRKLPLIVVAAGALVLAACSGSGSAGSDNGAITMYATTGYAQNLDSNTFTKYVEKKFNVKLKWDLVPQSDASSKQSLALSSGDYPDVFWSANFTQPDILKYANQKVFIPLNSLLKQYAPNVWKAIQTDPFLKASAVAPDGNVYSLPHYNYCMHCSFPQKMWINVKYLKQYHLAIPTTTTEFEHVLQVFKQHGILPMTSPVDWGYNMLTYLMDPFIYNPGWGGSWFDVDGSGKLTFAPSQAGWRAGLKYIHDLYSKGLISNVALTQQTTDMERQLSQKKVGAFTNLCVQCINVSDWQDWMAVPPLKGPTGLRYSTFAAPASGGTFAITNKASKADQIGMMKLLNLMYTTTGQLYEDYGPSGSPLWSKAKAGTKGLAGQPAQFDINWDKVSGSAGELQNDGWNQMGPMYQSKDWFDANVVRGDAPTVLQLVTQMFYIGLAPDKVVPSSLWVAPDSAQTFSTQQANIDTYVEQWAGQFITGTKSLDSDWSGYVKGLNGLGLSQYTTTAQKAMKEPLSTADYKLDENSIRQMLSLMPQKELGYQMDMVKTAYTKVRGATVP
jgi:putative aldouronate transport system substrate-binding protein